MVPSPVLSKRRTDRVDRFASSASFSCVRPRSSRLRLREEPNGLFFANSCSSYPFCRYGKYKEICLHHKDKIDRLKRKCSISRVVQNKQTMKSNSYIHGNDRLYKVVLQEKEGSTRICSSLRCSKRCSILIANLFYAGVSDVVAFSIVPDRPCIGAPFRELFTLRVGPNDSHQTSTA